MKFLNPGFTICSSSCTLYATHTLTWNIHFIIIEKDFRRFWRKTLWRWTIWRIQIWCLINLTKSTIWRKIQFDEIFLRKDNLTKYLKLYRDISSNGFFFWNCIEIFREIVLFATNICWILLFLKFISPNCLRQIVFYQNVQRAWKIFTE